MNKTNTFTLEDFKTLVATDDEFKDNIIKKEDFIDLDNGVMRIYAENVNKYLEKYACKSVEELEDTLYFSYGIYCEVI